jgi:hypothetical protein
LEQNVPSNPVLHQLMKAAEIGESDRSGPRFTAHNTA